MGAAPRARHSGTRRLSKNGRMGLFCVWALSLPSVSSTMKSLADTARLRALSARAAVGNGRSVLPPELS
jgi:hypothetical protein